MQQHRKRKRPGHNERIHGGFGLIWYFVRPLGCVKEVLLRITPILWSGPRGHEYN